MPQEDVGKLFSLLVTHKNILSDYLNRESRLETLGQIKNEFDLHFEPEEEAKLLEIEADNLSVYAKCLIERQQITRERE